MGRTWFATFPLFQLSLQILKKTNIFSITVGNIILVSGVHRGKQTRGREFNGNTCAKMIMKSGDIKYY